MGEGQVAATIKMVAELAGVSVATVSKYLNGGNVYAENRIKVQAAVDALNYKVNEVARSLKTNKTNTIGILAPSIQSIFITGVISQIQYKLLECGYSTLIVDYQMNDDLEKRQLDILLKRQVDGIVIFPRENEKDLVNTIKDQNIPVVTVDNMLEGIACDAVLADNMGGAYEATEELIKHQHKRIGIIAGPAYMYTAKERLKGYFRAHEDYFIGLEEELICYGEYTEQSGYKCFNELMNLREPPTAIFVTNYHMTIGALGAVNERNMKLPEELSLIAFDQLEFASIMRPPISVVEQPLKQIGEKVAEIILRRMKEDWRDFPHIERLKTTLKRTGSVAGNIIK